MLGRQPQGRAGRVSSRLGPAQEGGPLPPQRSHDRGASGGARDIPGHGDPGQSRRQGEEARHSGVGFPQPPQLASGLIRRRAGAIKARSGEGLTAPSCLSASRRRSEGSHRFRAGDWCEPGRIRLAQHRGCRWCYRRRDASARLACRRYSSRRSQGHDHPVPFGLKLFVGDALLLRPGHGQRFRRFRRLRTLRQPKAE